MIQLIKGFKDILPGEIETWQQIETIATALFSDFGFREIRIPVMEKTELFARSIGEDTDIVEKEMYTFPDRNGDLITLRPEATASVCRSYIQHKMYAVDPVQKFFTIGPMFRRENPQKGRYRQFYQINAEILGVPSPLADVELIFLLETLFGRLKVPDTEAHINSLGCQKCRPVFKSKLKTFLASRKDRLCADCMRRKDRNPLRVLDCKVPSCKEAMLAAPSILECLCAECERHFTEVKQTLKSLKVPFTVDNRLVRGLDYYTRTTFEMHTERLGAQSAVAGGGRYDGLIPLLNGPDTSATGFAIGFDRLAEIVASVNSAAPRRPDLYIAALGHESQAKAFRWRAALGKAGLKVEMDFENRSLKSQMKRADKMAAGHTLILGAQELEKGVAVVRNMSTGEQLDLQLDQLPLGILEKLQKNKR